MFKSPSEFWLSERPANKNNKKKPRQRPGSNARSTLRAGGPCGREEGKSPGPCKGPPHSQEAHRPAFRAQKRISKEIKDFVLIVSLKCRVQKLRFLAFPGGPGVVRDLREAGRIHFHLSWYLIVPGITSYVQKPWGVKDV